MIPTRDPAPGTPPPPDWFRSASLKVRIVRDQFVAVELSGEVDFETATEERLRNGGVAQGQVPSFQGLGSQNPADGIVRYQILYQRDPASQTEQVKLYLGADPNGRDGLIYTGQLAGQALEEPSFGRNVLGMTAVFTPLLAAVAPANPTDGDVTALVLTGAAIALPVTPAELGFFNIERVVLYGGELEVTSKAGQWVSTLLFDVETAVSADIASPASPCCASRARSRWPSAIRRWAFRWATRPARTIASTSGRCSIPPGAVRSTCRGRGRSRSPSRSARSSRCSAPGSPAPTS